MNIAAGFGVLFASAVLGGCASLGPEYVHRDGWRPGTVTEVGSGREIVERLSNTCVPGATDSAYALIRYTGNSHLRWRAFPIPEGRDVRVGDKVSLDVNACQFARTE